MPKIYSFSIPDKNKSDKQILEDIKELCSRRKLNFSGVVTEQLKKWYEEQLNANPR